MPEWFFIGVIFVFGLVIGSFLNVVIYRFHTGRSLNDRSHCLSCGGTLAWYELFPVFSYLTLRGRCRRCHSFIPYRYALVELLTAGLFVLAYLQTSDWFILAALLIFLALLVIVTVYDLYHMIIPDELSLALAFIAAAIVGYQAWTIGDIGYWFLALGAGFVAFLFFASLWWFSGGRWLGFGDAKLAVSLGIMSGLLGVFSLIVWAFWVGAAISLLVLAFRYLSLSTRLGWGRWARVRMKSEVPFAPFLIISFILVYFFDLHVLNLVEALVYANF